MRRGSKLLLDRIDWTVEEDERWAVLGPERRGQDDAAAGRGGGDAPHLRTRRTCSASGWARWTCSNCARASAWPVRPIAERIPNAEQVVDVVVSAGYAVIGRWREAYGRLDVRRAGPAARPPRRRGAGRAHLRHAEPGRAAAGADRPGADDRPRAVVAGRAGRRHGPGRSRGSAAPAHRVRRGPDAPASVLVTHHVEEMPPAISHVMLLRDGAVVAAGLATDVLTDELLSRTFGLAAAGGAPRRPLVRLRRAERAQAGRQHHDRDRPARCSRW